MKISARNQLVGVVKSIASGAVNGEVVVELPGGSQIVSIVTNDAITSLDLQVGAKVIAVVKASHVMLAVD